MSEYVAELLATAAEGSYPPSGRNVYMYGVRLNDKPRALLLQVIEKMIAERSISKDRSEPERLRDALVNAFRAYAPSVQGVENHHSSAAVPRLRGRVVEDIHVAKQDVPRDHGDDMA